MFQSLRQPGVMMVTLAAAGILMVTMGVRQSFGLFVAPISQSTGLSVVSISFALAVGQLAWGAIQPVAGIYADRYGSERILMLGLLLLALACGWTVVSSSVWGLTLSLGLLANMGAGIASFSVLMGAVAQKIPAAARGEASGLINAGGSFGQVVFAPTVQQLIAWMGWVGCLLSLAVTSLLALPLIRKLRDSSPQLSTAKPERSANTGQQLKQTVVYALRDRNYLLLNIGFFTCGFHIAFLVTHLPGEIDLCGLPPSVAGWSLALIGLANVVGSIVAGACVARYKSKNILALMYASRALLVLWYMLMPKTEWVFYVFALGLGLSWLATVPPTASIVTTLYGSRYLATLFGLSLLSHQIGAFFGAWLGGVALYSFGDFSWMWWADIALALIAAGVNLPIQEKRQYQMAANH